MHLQQTYIDLVSPAYHLWQTGVFLYEPRIDAYITFNFFHVAPFTGLLALSSIKDLKEKVMAFSI